ncbi:MAG TPA: hypothetical protein VGO62_14605, partial [Myxococcota bacterium]
PLKANADPIGASATGASLLPVVRRGLAQNLVFTGDLPYPNSEVPGIASVSRVAGQAISTNVAFTDEITGPCTPWNPTAPLSAQCKTTQSTLVQGSYVAADDCTSAQANARTCPWAMHKWVNGSATDTFLTFVGTDGKWYERKIVNIDGLAPITNVDTFVGVTLAANFPVAGGGVIDPQFFLGAGYATVLDRVFFAVEDPASPGAACAAGNCTLFRRQCWGRIGDPSNANFPAAGAGFYGTTQTPTGCAAPSDGTGWEVLATGISSFSFSYFTNTAALAAPLNAADRDAVRAVQVDMAITRKVAGTARTTTLNVQRRFFLNDREGG